MNRKKWAALLGVAAFVFLTAEACTNANSNYEEARKVNEQQLSYTKTQAIPKFTFSQDRDTLIQIYMLKNEARNTYSVFSSNGTGEQRFQCPSVGYAIPADTQLTAPESTNGVPQAEPNGLFSSTNTDGTWVLCVRANGEVVPVYTELKVTTFPFAVRYENGQYVEVQDSKSTATMKITRK